MVRIYSKFERVRAEKTAITHASALPHKRSFLILVIVAACCACERARERALALTNIYLSDYYKRVGMINIYKRNILRQQKKCCPFERSLAARTYVTFCTHINLNFICTPRGGYGAIDL